MLGEPEDRLETGDIVEHCSNWSRSLSQRRPVVAVCLDVEALPLWASSLCRDLMDPFAIFERKFRELLAKGQTSWPMLHRIHVIC